MSEAIVYCDRCSHIIRPGEIADGLALIGPNAAVCHECSKKIAPEQRAEILGSPAAAAGGASASGRASARGVAARRRAVTPATWGLVLAGVGAGALAAIAMVLLSGDSDEPGVRPIPLPERATVPAAPSAIAPPPPHVGPQDAAPQPASRDWTEAARGPARSEEPATLGERIERLRGYVANLPERYDEFTAESGRFLKDFPDAPDAVEVRKMVEEAGSRIEKQAEEDLAGAVKTAEALIELGRLDEVAGAFAYLRARYAGSEWLKLQGELKIAEVLARAESARTAQAAPAAPPPDASVAAAPAARAAPAADVPTGRLAEGLVGYWKFDEAEGRTARDSSSNGNDGTLSGAPEWRPAGGKLGGALFLRGEGSGDCVNVPDSPGLSPTEALTLAAWVNGTTYPHVPNIMAKDGNNSFRWRIVWFDMADNKAKGFWLLLNDGGNWDGQYVEHAIMPGEWHHVAATADTAKREVRFYVDGAQIAPPLATPKSRIADTGGALAIGASDGWGNEAFHGLLDEVRVYDRALSPAEIAALAVFGEEHIIALAPTAAERDRLMTEGVASPETDGYLLTPKMIHNLTQRFDAGRVNGKTLAAAGGAVAASSRFDASLKKELAKGDGYLFASGSGVAGGRKTVGVVRKAIARYLERQKPEVVRICFDATDLAKGRPAALLRDGVAETVDAVLGAGAVPVLFTLPMLAVDDPNGRALLEGYNRMILDLAREKDIPCIDAYGLLNRDAQAQKLHFRPNGALRSEGCDALNTSFLRLYRVLEHWVLGRRSSTELAKVPEAAPRDDASGKPAAAEPGPARPVTAAGLVANGGFEEKGPNATLADGWQRGQWGARGKQCSVRLDRANARSGEHALELRAIDEGAQPGAATFVALEPGTYELRYWACTDQGKSATVRVRFAGRDLAEASAGDEWRHITGTLEVAKKQRRAELRLSTSTAGVRVWMDDVEIVPVK